MITDLKDYEKWLKICRKYGVTEANLGTQKVKFGDLPSKDASATDGGDQIPTDELSGDDLIFYAVGEPHP